MAQEQGTYNLYYTYPTETVFISSINTTVPLLSTFYWIISFIKNVYIIVHLDFHPILWYWDLLILITLINMVYYQYYVEFYRNEWLHGYTVLTISNKSTFSHIQCHFYLFLNFHCYKDAKIISHYFKHDYSALTHM